MSHYDAIVVGARVAGAATAMLLARRGHRVLLLDRADPATDTLSTHALMQPGVTQLRRWGLLERVIAAGTPTLDRVTFRYPDETVHVDLQRPVYAPRRTVLDPIILAAAADAGAEVRIGPRVERLARDDDGRVRGVITTDRACRRSLVTANWVIGADGMRSTVARSLRPTATRVSPVASAIVLGYVAGLDLDGLQWCYAPGQVAGLIPTNAGLTCVWAGIPAPDFATVLRPDLHAGLLDVIARTAPELAGRVAAAEWIGPVRGFPGRHGWLRRPWGPGWALVGDAAYFKDPITGHGMSDALRDAELLAIALDRTRRGETDAATALRAYERTRDALSLPLLAATERIAAFDWTIAELREALDALSAANQADTRALLDLDRDAVAV
jgi:2-polyprenyl-6-methoxyphenol hydroxylase-like FAD-dependent oxidoreductase